LCFYRFIIILLLALVHETPSKKGGVSFEKTKEEKEAKDEEQNPAKNTTTLEEKLKTKKGQNNRADIGRIYSDWGYWFHLLIRKTTSRFCSCGTI